MLKISPWVKRLTRDMPGFILNPENQIKWNLYKQMETCFTDTHQCYLTASVPQYLWNTILFETEKCILVGVLSCLLQTEQRNNKVHYKKFVWLTFQNSSWCYEPWSLHFVYVLCLQIKRADCKSDAWFFFSS